MNNKQSMWVWNPACAGPLKDRYFALAECEVVDGMAEIINGHAVMNAVGVWTYSVYAPTAITDTAWGAPFAVSAEGGTAPPPIPERYTGLDPGAAGAAGR